MSGRCLRWLAPVLLAGACLLPGVEALGQPGAGDKGLRGSDNMGTAPPAPSGPLQPGEPRESAPKDILPTFVAAISVILVLVIVCMPSRKN
jgi:hypothetical protein